MSTRIETLNTSPDWFERGRVHGFYAAISDDGAQYGDPSELNRILRHGDDDDHDRQYLAGYAEGKAMRRGAYWHK